MVAPDAALAALVRRIDPAAVLGAATALQGGVSARVVDLEIARSGRTEHWVLRIPPDDPDLDAATEFALLRALRRLDFPVPEPIHLADPPRDLDAPALVMAHVEHEGEHAGHTPQAMAALLARLHALPIDSFDFLPRAVPEALPASIPHLDAAVGDALLAVARAHPPATSPPLVLRHGDWWPGNLLWRDGRIVAVIDWEEARLGDALQDLAVARLEICWAANTQQAEQFTDSYRALTGAACGALPAWDLHSTLMRLSWMDRWGLSPQLLAYMRGVGVRFAQDAAARLA